MKKPSASEITALFITIGFALCYALLIAAIFAGAFYNFKEVPVYREGAETIEYKTAPVSIAVSAAAIISIILLPVTLIFNYYVYTKPKCGMTKKHFLLEFLLFLIAVFPMWKYTEIIMRSIK